ncbi:hypothetical protein FTS55_15620 [Salmonella enterica subsp. enterica]|nr:hypothetical protein [Salmonella enterica subsp. enterica serovar Menston]
MNINNICSKNMVNLLAVKSELVLMPLSDTTTIRVQFRQISEGVVDCDYLYVHFSVGELLRSLIKERYLLRRRHAAASDIDKVTRLCKEIQEIESQNYLIIRKILQAEGFLSLTKSLFTFLLIFAVSSLIIGVFVYAWHEYH